MRAPDGSVFPMTGVFRTVGRGRIEFTTTPLDDHGEPIFETLNTVELRNRGPQTEVTVRVSVTRKTPPAEQYLAGMEQGWSMTLDRLAREVDQAAKQ
jgi:uncharacterized protein YndB with AHSA1/START domain